METSSSSPPLHKNKSVIRNMVKEEKKSSDSNINGHEDDQTINKEEERHVKEERIDLKPPSPNAKDVTIAIQVPSVNMDASCMEIDTKNQHESEEDELKSAREEMDGVREENERLKSMLGQLVKDYQSLHTHFLQVLQQEGANKKCNDDTTVVSTTHEDEEPEFVSLSLGRRSSEPRKDIKSSTSNPSVDEDQDESLNQRLKLGLDCRFDKGGDDSTDNVKQDSSFDNKNNNNDNSLEEAKEDEPVETWPPSKVQKTARSGDLDDDVLQHSHLKKARVSIRARCDTPTMNDGCQWRKYGQKIAKGNPCPRAYYRCTISPTCPVRKQVQRCAEDMSVLITTYEGNHNHPLPVSATAMASTTSAAAAMLNSRSSSSQPGLGTSTSANLHGLNFTFPHNSISSSSSSSRSAQPQHMYFPHSTITTSNSHPTITLDLTAQTTFPNYGRFSSAIPRTSPSCLNFSSSSSEAFHQTPWAHPNNYFNYASSLANYNKPTTNIGSALNIGLRQQNLSQEQFYQPYGISNQNPSLTDTIAAATKAITSNPTFRSALTAALTSYVGNGAQDNQGSGALQLQSRPPASIGGGFPFAQNGSTVGCASSFLNKSSPLSNPHHTHQQGSLVLFPPAVRQVSASKSGSGSPPDDSKDHPK